MNKMPPMKEHQLMTLLKNYLQAKGWWVMRINSGAIRATNKYGNQHMVRLAEVGMPDLMAFRSADRGIKDYFELTQLLFIEVKVPGNKPTFLQIRKMKELEEFGARCIVIHSLEELEKEL